MVKRYDVTGNSMVMWADFDKLLKSIDEYGKNPIQPLNVFLESREFYEACQQYRHSSDPVDTLATFEALKEWIRQGAVT